MFKKTKEFLFASVSCLVILCVVIFLWIGSTMSGKSLKAINEIGKLYMSEMSKQLQQKFDAIISLQISQLEGVVKRTPPETVSYGEDMLEDLALSAEVRQFVHLGLYRKDGTGETVFGEPVDFTNEEEFKNTIADNEKSITSGFSAGGEKLLLIVVDADYPMADGLSSDVVVAGITMEYLEDALVLEEDNSMVYSHIIRDDGEFVVRSGDAFRDNYFKRIEEVISREEEKNPEDYLEELKSAMADGKDYSALLMDTEGVHQHLYCASLSESSWYLVSVMPYGVLDDAIINLNGQRQTTILVACGSILLAVGIIFVLYYRLTQQQLRELERAEKAAFRANQAKSEFLSSMSHDIRTPMNAIVGFASLLSRDADNPVKVLEYTRKISSSSQHLLGLINDILDISKIEAGKTVLNLTDENMSDLIENIDSIIRPQMKSKKHVFEVIIKDLKHEQVVMDKLRLNQILLNLLSNAVKYTPEGGHVSFTIQELEQYARTLAHFRFIVADNGYGMSPEYVKKIFQAFTREEDSVTNKIQGTGLGMAITKNLLDLMGGKITVESEKGKGSVFTVDLELQIGDQERKPHQHPETELSDKQNILEGMHILVAEDNEINAEILTELLDMEGATCEIYENGRLAVDAFGRSAVGQYDLILMDVQMPLMNGYEATKAIRNLSHPSALTIPIIAMTANAFAEDIREALDAGMNAHAAKPIDMAVLAQTVQTVLEQI